LNKEQAAQLMCIPAFPDGWDFFPVYRHGELAGFFCTRENEIHCYRLSNYAGRWFTRQDLERLTKPLFDKYGEIITKVRDANDTGHEFVERLGFVPYDTDSECILYRAERIKHARL
jgi:hypothetical protein